MRITRLSLIRLRLSELADEMWFRVSLGLAAVMLVCVAIFVYGPPCRFSGSSLMVPDGCAGPGTARRFAARMFRKNPSNQSRIDDNLSYEESMSEDEPTRTELLEARERLKEQLAIVSNPSRALDYNPTIVAKLQAMIADITDCLAEPISDA